MFATPSASGVWMRARSRSVTRCTHHPRPDGVDHGARHAITLGLNGPHSLRPRSGAFCRHVAFYGHGVGPAGSFVVEPKTRQSCADFGLGFGRAALGWLAAQPANITVASVTFKAVNRVMLNLPFE